MERLNVVLELLKEDPDFSQKIQIDEAMNGQQALDMFKNCQGSCSNPNCHNKFYKTIIMDLQMPVMDGFDATSEILKFQETIKL